MRASRLAVLLIAAASACLAQFRAGAAKQLITPDLSHGPVYMAGFGQNRAATGVHDELSARCLALAAQRTLVLCGVDSIGLFLDDVQKIRDAANDRLGEPVDIVVAALHDHEAPDTMGLWGPAQGKSGLREDYNLFLIDRVSEAAVDAVHAMRPARLKLANVKNPVLESFLHDDRPPVVHDPDLVVLSAVGADGKPIATLVNWANHPETLGSKNTKITADYPAYFYKELEKRLGGIAVFLNGAVGGMQSPLGAPVIDPATKAAAPEESFRKAEIIGTTVAELAAAAVRNAARVPVDSIEFREQALELPVTNKNLLTASKIDLFGGRKAMAGDSTETVAGIFRLSGGGRAVLEGALIPGELYPELSVGGIVRYFGADFPDAPIEPPIKKMMAAPYRMLVGLADDEIGYIIPKAEWDEKAPWLEDAPKAYYGEVNSVGPEAAPRIAAAMQRLLAPAGKSPEVGRPLAPAKEKAK